MEFNEAEAILADKSLEELIEIWNDHAADQYERAYEIHSMDDNKWWAYLMKELEGRYFAEDLLKSRDYFCPKDVYFFYDVDDELFKSFSAKEDMLFVCSEDFFLEVLVKGSEE